MAGRDGREYVETLVIGGGQAGLATGYQLSRRDLPYKIIDANERVGDAWRNRWDSLRLFTPNRLNSLPGKPFPGYHWGFPSKNEMADYLESYARKFDLRVETGVRVERLTREGDRFVATSRDRRFEADNVVVAMSSWQRPRVPDYAPELDPRIVQLHVAEYKNPGQLQEGDVLVRCSLNGRKVGPVRRRCLGVGLWKANRLSGPAGHRRVSGDLAAQSARIVRPRKAVPSGASPTREGGSSGHHE